MCPGTFGTETLQGGNPGGENLGGENLAGETLAEETMGGMFWQRITIGGNDFVEMNYLTIGMLNLEN